MKETVYDKLKCDSLRTQPSVLVLSLEVTHEQV